MMVLMMVSLPEGNHDEALFTWSKRLICQDAVEVFVVQRGQPVET